MPSTIAQNRAALVNVKAAHNQAMPIMRAPGRIIFAGNLWPNPATGVGRQIQAEVTEAFEEARVLVFHGLNRVKAARRDNPEAIRLMTNWFGPRTVDGTDDWWLGVEYILTAMEQALLRDINVYYRGGDVVNRINDYPVGTPGAGLPLNAGDVAGFAETFRGANDLVIGLCDIFFSRDPRKVRTMSRKGFDSIGGVLVHEMSHNLCGTRDHTNAAGVFYYGEPACRAMITADNLARQAWYNADSIEYFTEESYYGILPPQPALAGLPVGNLTAAHEQAAVDAAVPQPSTTVVTTNADVGALAAAHHQAQAASAQPQASTTAVATNVDVKTLRDKFNK